ncbi:unnamed protein product [Sphenostylis stenocarpa]|uniref:Uncharacterized protein n=1 Tax=Sphenostylis stenocarpa TaxID=92480 RepID=A0AA86SEZ2_9FABA|nr:unnamed protein product [Sphenostylis stenocarpa]
MNEWEVIDEEEEKRRLEKVGEMENVMGVLPGKSSLAVNIGFLLHDLNDKQMNYHLPKKFN